MNVDKQMKTDVRFARQRYFDYLEVKKREKTEEEKAEEARKPKSCALYVRGKNLLEDNSQCLKNIDLYTIRSPSEVNQLIIESVLY